MRKALFIALLIATSFCFGFAFKTITSKQKTNNMRKVTGIGGIFFKCKDPNLVKEWYQKHLGLNTNPYGTAFEWYQDSGSTKKAVTQWTPFKETTRYFEPSTKDFMINYRVENFRSAP